MFHVFAMSSLDQPREYTFNQKDVSNGIDLCQFNLYLVKKKLYMISMMKLAKKFQNPLWKFLDQFQFPMKVCASPCLQKVQRGRIVLLLDR